jgi:Amt family ammonium transporter
MVFMKFMFKFDRVKYKFYESRFKMDRFVLYHCFGCHWRIILDPVTDIPDTGEFLSEDKIVGADVAWILAAAGLVLLMTPGYPFSTEEW